MTNQRLLKDLKNHLKPKVISVYKPKEIPYNASENDAMYKFKAKSRSEIVRDNDGYTNVFEYGLAPTSEYDECNIFFYEYSNIATYARHYTSMTSFTSMLNIRNATKNCKDDALLRGKQPKFVTINETTNELIVKWTRTGLMSEIEKSKSAVKTANNLLPLIL